jgi:hypothetical protein
MARPVVSQKQRCARGEHGPLLNTAKYEDAGPDWAGLGECCFCGSTVRTPGQGVKGVRPLPSPDAAHEEPGVARER